MVKGDTDSVYVKLYTKFQELVNRDSGPDKTNSYGITYIESFSILEFEKDKNTNIIIHHKDGNKRFATFKLGETHQVASINKDVTLGDEQQKISWLSLIARILKENDSGSYIYLIK